MSISVNRPQYASPLWSTSNSKQVSSPDESVARLPEPQPVNDVWQSFLSDSFEQGPGNIEQLTQMLGELTQLLSELQGGDSFETPQDLAAGPEVGAPAPQGFNASNTPTNPANPTHPTYDSDAGPGFGPPSAGSTEQVDPSTPWLAKNNVGSPYNSNMQLIDPSQKDQFKYTNTFTNNTNEPQTVTLWNKTGEDGGPNSGQYFDKSTPKTFTLQPGQSQTVAFDSNSSVAWCVSKDGTANPGANSGQTWGEATFANAGTGWSGYDVSQIEPAGHNGRMSISNDATGKTVTEANAWQTPSDNPAGLDVGVPAGPLSLTTTFN